MQIISEINLLVCFHICQWFYHLKLPASIKVDKQYIYTTEKQYRSSDVEKELVPY